MAQAATIGEVREIHYRDLAAAGLGGWLKVFVRCYSPRMFLAALAVVSVVRLLLGGFRSTDLVIIGAFCVAQPFTEWVVHVTVLHFKPVRMAGMKLDFYAARKHREHHRDPELVRLVFIQKPQVFGLIGGGIVLYLLAFRDIRLAATALWVGFVLVLVYEWTHFLIHSPYVPHSALYRRIWRTHRLHHFKNEHYWFGITSPVADHVLRTHPDRAAVPTSPTARTLGVAEIA